MIPANFENKVARFRKCRQMAVELKETAKTLEAECAVLEGQIFDEITMTPSRLNVFIRKTSSAGLAGRNMFTVSFSKEVARRHALDRLDDQEWLEQVSKKYTVSKLSLLKNKINADFKAGKLDEDKLRDMDLRYERKASLTVSLVPSDADLSRIREEALKLAGDEE